MLDHNSLELLRADVLDITRRVGTFIQQQVTKVTAADIITKQHNSLVSYVDTTAEERIVKALKKILPDAAFITEEDTVAQNVDAPLAWIIDPIDGTTNYLKGVPHYSTSIALRVDGEVVLGVVNDITQDTVYHTIKGHGAYANKERISIGQVEQLNEAIVVTGFPYERDLDFEFSLNMLTEMLRTARGVRRLGSAALDLAYVASGKLDIYYESNLNIWDVAAGNLLIEEAGGMITGYTGGQDYLNGNSLVCGNTSLHQTMLETITRIKALEIQTQS